MIYFIEHDSAENICHVCADPNITIVPLVNRILFNDASGNPLKDSSGNDLSPFGLPLVDPVAVTEAIFNTLMADGVDKYTFSVATNSIVKKVTP